MRHRPGPRQGSAPPGCMAPTGFGPPDAWPRQGSAPGRGTTLAGHESATWRPPPDMKAPEGTAGTPPGVRCDYSLASHHLDVISVARRNCSRRPVALRLRIGTLRYRRHLAVPVVCDGPFGQDQRYGVPAWRVNGLIHQLRPRQHHSSTIAARCGRMVDNAAPERPHGGTGATHGGPRVPGRRPARRRTYISVAGPTSASP